MATTDARAGFRLPWSSDRSSSETTESDQTETPVGELATEFTDETRAAIDWPASDGAPAPTESAVDEPEPAAPPPPPSSRKPSKFLADLTKAMQAAAEEQRTAAVGQLQADAKAHVEAIHGRSSTEAATLRRTADVDVASIREWSKTEIARIREETETKINDRKAQLERQIDEHAAVIEREIEAVTATVSSFEAEMASFFERLLAAEDPARFATMAETLPAAPSFDGIVAAATAAAVDAAAEAAAAVVETDPVEAAVEPVPDVDTTDEPQMETESAEATAEAGEASVDADGEATGVVGTDENGEHGDGEYDREAAFAAIQAAAEAAASAEVAADAAARAEAVADVAIEIMGNHEDGPEADPRMTALGLSPDYDAAEAEALAAADGSSDEEIPVIEDDALASRLAGLVPGKGGTEDGSSTATTVVVTGLVSVASIASFKRHLGRLPGVSAVGVSSGPDGEFVFAVSHGPDVALRDVIPGLPSFQARVTGSGEGTLNVTAHDPESDS
jgi:hypothetical protein